MISRRTRKLMALTLAVGGAATAQAWAQGASDAIYRGLLTVERADVSRPLRDMAVEPPTNPAVPNPLKDRPTGLERAYGPQDVNAQGGREDPVRQTETGGGEIAAPIVGFNAFSGTAQPPDPNGSVGPNHFVVMANVSYAVDRKSTRLNSSH